MRKACTTTLKWVITVKHRSDKWSVGHVVMEADVARRGRPSDSRDTVDREDVISSNFVTVCVCVCERGREREREWTLLGKWPGWRCEER